MIYLPKFETNITTACTNTCICCDHYSPFQKPAFVDPEQIERDLIAAKRILRAGDYRLIGGEPTLHPQLLEIIDIAHRVGIADTVSVWTNGMRLRKMPSEFWEKADGIAVTVYPKLPADDLAWIRNKVRETGRQYQEVNHNGRFNRTFSAQETNQADALRMYATCIYRSCNEYDNGWFYHCNNAAFISRLVLGLPEGTDGINLYTATEDEFRAYLDDRSKPYQSCYRCVQTKLIGVAWREVSREEWREMSEYHG